MYSDLSGQARTESLAMHPSDPSSMPQRQSLSDEDRQRAGRRAAILSGLGKGSVALAAMAPLASQASRSHVLFNPTKNQNCYCTVSGFQSAALSPSTGANPPTCAAYLPRTFLKMTVTKIVYATALAPNTVNGPNLKAYLKALPGVAEISKGVMATLLASTPVPLKIAGGGAGDLDTVFLPIDGGSCYFLQVRNFPVGISGVGTFKSIFANSDDGRTLLEVLFDGVTPADGGLNSSPPNAKCLFLAAYLSVANTNVSPSLPADLSRGYITGQYGGDADGVLSSNAGLFFSKLCSLSA